MLAEQLANLQNILSASNTNTMEENTHLARTIAELQTVNVQLQTEIAKQVQINQANASHIADMQAVLEEKDVELQELQNTLAERDASLEASIMQVTEQQRFIQEVKGCVFVVRLNVSSFVVIVTRWHKPRRAKHSDGRRQRRS